MATPIFTLEVEPSVQDQDWFRAHIDFWQPRICPALVFMRLVSIEETADEGVGRYATCITYQGGTAATLGISPTFYLQSEREQEITLVHELLHVTLFPINATSDPPRKKNALRRLAMDAHENVAETLSRGFMAVAYGDNE